MSLKIEKNITRTQQEKYNNNNATEIDFAEERRTKNTAKGHRKTKYVSKVKRKPYEHTKRYDMNYRKQQKNTCVLASGWKTQCIVHRGGDIL